MKEAEKKAMELKEENNKTSSEMKEYYRQWQESKEQLKKLRLNVNVMIRKILQDVCNKIDYKVYYRFLISSEL